MRGKKRSWCEVEPSSQIISKEVKEYQLEEREDLSDKVIFEQRHEGFKQILGKGNIKC